MTRDLYPQIEPYDRGFLDVGDGHRIYWETCGRPNGKLAVVLHGGPGSGCSPWHRRLFDPGRYRIVLFDQRGCGLSTPHAGGSDAHVAMANNTTAHLVADIEQLREHLGIDSWLVLGGSWGSTLALAYAEAHPSRVSEMVLFGVTTGRHSEFDWTFRGGLARFFPEQWDRLRAGAALQSPDEDIVEAYDRLLNDSNDQVRRLAAIEWCTWEAATPDWPPKEEFSGRFEDPSYRLAFARIVTSYVRHYAWLDDGELLRNAGQLRDIPGALINGRFDFQAPLSNAWGLKRAWPSAELVIVDDAGHAAGSTGITSAIIDALDRFASPQD